MSLRLVVSGGQIGADVAGLRAAKAAGLETGGWMPFGFRTQAGPRPQYAEVFGLQETSDPEYPHRTEKNVLWGDATLRLALTFGSPGERLTARLCGKHARPMLDVPLYYMTRDTELTSLIQERVLCAEVTADAIVEWLAAERVEVLNVAGNARPDIEGPVEYFLREVFRHAA